MKCAFVRVFCILLCAPSPAQQTDINRYTLYTGLDYMISPARNLTECGFEVDFGVTLKPWLAVGGDFSAMGNDIISGAGTINGSETIYAPGQVVCPSRVWRDSRAGPFHSAPAVGAVIAAPWRPGAQLSPDGHYLFLWRGRRLRSQRVPACGVAVHNRLGEHASVLQSADQPAKLRQVFDRPNLSLGTFEVMRRGGSLAHKLDGLRRFTRTADSSLRSE